MIKRILTAAAALLSLGAATAQSPNPFPELKWVEEVGARSFPEKQAVFVVNRFGAKGDAVTLDTEAIQRAIDACAEAGGGKVTFEPGIYLTGSIFIRSNIDFHVPKGTTLIGSQNLDDYKRIDTRVAGIEMEWPAALVNILDAENAAISGDGTINGRGKPFWDKYWSMRRDDYEPRGLRWIVDYDCDRPRGVLISKCRNVTVRDVVIYQAGFWSLHILYSQHVTVDGVIISNNIEGKGPSTDGIDVDSSSDVLVQNCNINCNDDNFCLKAGRDWDGLRVNRPCERVVIRDCVAGLGGGLITCGSETSGSIRDIVAYNLKARGTGGGLRFKSTVQRGGTIENIYVADVEMDGVRSPFVVDLNWNPAYSTSVLPAEYEGKELPPHWKKMLAPVSLEEGTPTLRNFYFKNITAVNAGVCISAVGIETSTIDNVHFDNVTLSGRSAGRVSWCNDWQTGTLSVKGDDGAPVRIEHSKHVTIK